MKYKDIKTLKEGDIFRIKRTTSYGIDISKLGANIGDHVVLIHMDNYSYRFALVSGRKFYLFKSHVITFVEKVTDE